MAENKQHTEIAKQAMEEMSNNVAANQQGSPNNGRLLHIPNGGPVRLLKADDPLNALSKMAE